MAQQPDPSMGVPQELMAHVHLVSSSRYPMMAQANLQEVAKWLMAAPHVARDKSPFFWTFLDKPENGTVMMTWQPLQRLGTNFATDGFVWAPPEQLYKHDLGNGLIMEIYYLKTGYAPGEPVAARARRRFRLVPVPGQAIHHNPDPNLFIVHYGPSEPHENIPSHVIPYDERVNATMQARHYVIQGGQLRRKEFMLSDRGNWPALPEVPRQAWGRQMPPRQVPQQMAYPPQANPGPPAKRARHAQAQAQQQQQQQQQPPHPDAILEDDEDIARGDMFDLITPKDLALQRYKQNHEWMEEILSSPYKMKQITPPDLNLGLTGELASLTKGIFEAQGGNAWMTSPEKPYIGRLEPGKAEEFRKRVSNHLETTKAEIEKMQAEHAQALAKFKERSILSIKEKELRTAIAESGTEVWRIELPNEADGESGANAANESIDELTRQVEAVMGRKIKSHPDVKCIKNGGWQAPAPEPEPPAQTQMSRQGSQSGYQNNAPGESEGDVDMGGTAAGLLDQMHTGLSSGTTPVNNFPTPQAQASAAQSSAATPSQSNNVPSPAAAQPAAPQGGDVTMGGTSGPAKEQSASAPDQGTGSGDWVVVPKNADNTPEANARAASGTPKPAAPAAGSVKGPSNAGTPAAATESGFDQNDFSSLGDLDTAGDALAGFGDNNDLGSGGGDMGDGLDLNMEMEDSAFGDAFHGVSASGTPGDNGQGNDM